MPGEEDALKRIAEAISDGAPVDWEAAAAAGDHLQPGLRRLRLVESIAGAHRTARGETGASSLMETVITGDPAGTALRSWGHLELRAPLGQGGFGEVYRAHDPRLDIDVALKLRRADRTGDDPFQGRFVEEARKLARVRHPHVLTVYGADEHDGRVGLWTELLEGETLEDVLQRQGVFSAREAAGIGIDLLHALAAVHGAGLIHRDVKTSNVMRERGGRIVLMDFGSVTEVRPAEGGGQRVSGTPVAMAPEILRGETPGPASDLYSVGVLLYRLVSDRYPVEAATWAELLDRLAQGFRPLRDVRPDVPDAFAQVVERALHPDPAARFPSAGAMEAALAVAVGVPRPATPEPSDVESARVAPPRPPLGRRRALAATAVLALAGGGWLVKEWLEPPPDEPAASRPAPAQEPAERAGASGPAPARTEPAAEAPAPKPFQVRAELRRSQEEGDLVLGPEAVLRVNDRLYMEVESSEPAHLYLVNEDEIGNVWLLFPLSGYDLENPIPAGTHRLPGTLAGQERSWVVSSAGGTETFLMIASRDPLPEIEAEIARLPQAAEAGAAPLDAAGQGRLRGAVLRGIGGTAPAPPRAPGPGALAGITEELPALATGEAGVQVQKFRVRNPRP